MLSLLLLASLRAASSPDATRAFREVAVIVGLIGLAALIGRVLTLRTLALAAVAVAAAYALSALALQLLTAAAGIGLEAQRAGSVDFFGYSNFRFYNHVQTVALPLMLGVAALDPNPRWRWLARVGAAAGFALLFHAFGRATGLALVVAAALVLVAGWVTAGVLRTHAWIWLREMVVASLAGLALLGLLMVLIGGASGQISGSREGSHFERMVLVRISLEHALASPWFGIGPMHLAGRPGLPAAHPHNAWVQVAAEWGFPAMLALLAAVGLAIRRLWQAVRGVGERDPQYAAWGLVLLATGVAVLVDSLFSGNFVMPMSQLWIAVLGGAILAWWRGLPGRAEPPRAWLGRPAVAVILLLQVWLLASIWPEVRRWPEFHQELVERYPNNVINPRFWSHGWFGEPGPR